MSHNQRSRFWLVAVLVIAVAGILSRTLHTGLILLDKYLGDSLYAAMFYAIFRLFLSNRSAAIASMAWMTALEFFQLTLIPLHMLGSPNSLVRIVARLLGTTFSFYDLAAYAIGISAAALVERVRNQYAR